MTVNGLPRPRGRPRKRYDEPGVSTGKPGPIFLEDSIKRAEVVLTSDELLEQYAGRRVRYRAANGDVYDLRVMVTRVQRKEA